MSFTPRFERVCSISTYVVAGMVFLPVAILFAAWHYPAGSIWQHLATNLLPLVLRNTIFLVAGVVSLTAIIGVSLGWFVAIYDFPGRNFLRWALLGSLAIPTYVFAFVFCGVFDYSGPVQVFLRGVFQISEQNLINVRSPVAVVFVLSLALFPYVYLISYSAFASQGKRVLEVSRSLGCNADGAFFRTALPMARPWILGALMLVTMETLADFGAVSIFVFETFTTAIYKAWFGFFSPYAAAQLASLLVTVVFALLMLEFFVERSKSYAVAGAGIQPSHLKLSKKARIAVAGFAWFIWIISFLLPLTQICYWVISYAYVDFNLAFLSHIFNSLTIASVVALVVTLTGFFLSFSQRFSKSRHLYLFNRFALVGYALPGSVLAVGVFLPLVWFDQLLADAWLWAFKHEVGLIFTGSIAAMVVGLSIRFLAVAHTPVNNGTRRISGHIDEVAASLGAKGFLVAKRVHLPLLRNSLVVAAILVFVDVLKEMPLTLMTRPFGWDTLAVRIFELTSEGEWERAALPAMILILAGLVPVSLLAKGLQGNDGR